MINTTYKIYKISNTINNKLYIGQTKQTLQKRFIGHKTKSSNGSKCVIHSAMRLYGFKNFSIELVYECTNLEEINKKEIFYIKYYSSISPNGYNILEGGNTAPNITGPFTEEHKNKLKEAHRKNCKSVSQFNIETGQLIKDWFSSRDIVRGGFNRANIINLCKSEKGFGYIYDYGWCYKSKYDIISNKSILAVPGYNAHGRTIKCLDMNGNLVKIYYKIADAARELKCNPSSIADVIKGRAKRCKGFYWAYAD